MSPDNRYKRYISRTYNGDGGPPSPLYVGRSKGKPGHRAVVSLVPGLFLLSDYPSALLKLLLAELEGIELVVAPLQVEKLLMGALLHDLAVGQQDNVVRMLDGAQAMGYDQIGRASCRERV